MANTITTDLDLQVMQCRVCGEQTEIARKLLRDQHALLEMQDDFAADHSDCRQYATQPHMAALHRKLRKGVRREERLAA